MKRIIIFCLIAGAAAALSAQDQAPPSGESATLPPGPLFKPFPSNLRWTIIRKTSSDAAKRSAQKDSREDSGADAKDGSSNRFDVQIVGEKVGDISHTVTTYGNGNKKEVWKKGNRQTTKATGWKEPVAGVAAGDDSEDLGWVSASNFSGIQKSSGAEVMIFRDSLLPQAYRQRPDLLAQQASAPQSEEEREYRQRVKEALGEEVSTPDAGSLAQEAVAYIDLATRLPLALQMGDTISTYKYQALPDSYILTLPNDVVAAMQARAEALQSTMRAPVSP